MIYNFRRYLILLIVLLTLGCSKTNTVKDYKQLDAIDIFWTDKVDKIHEERVRNYQNKIDKTKDEIAYYTNKINDIKNKIKIFEKTIIDLTKEVNNVKKTNQKLDLLEKQIINIENDFNKFDIETKIFEDKSKSNFDFLKENNLITPNLSYAEWITIVDQFTQKKNLARTFLTSLKKITTGRIIEKILCLSPHPILRIGCAINSLIDFRNTIKGIGNILSRI
jgi:archaellum component FlaC